MQNEINELTSQVVDVVSKNSSKFSLWNPSAGYETLALLKKLTIPDEGKEILLREASSILSRCIPPESANRNVTGLVIGYVQSGKTMSFTTVTALACDNRYQIIIVITGISDPLFKQSAKRLLTDLELNTRPDRRWQYFPNPSIKSRVDHTIADILSDWKDPTVPASEQQTVLITVMKNHIHLKNLIQMLSKLNLEQVPTLVIDDEADQAGLNTLVKKGDESTTYQRLLRLRENLPHHTFLQYTATPQAPLLINLIDVLSPDFAEVLTPGADYTGGKEFFLENPYLVKVIPPSEIPTQQNEIMVPPATLLYAMKLFFLGVASGWIKNQGKGNRSMLVHPSQKTLGHGQYFHWVTQAKEQWKNLLELEERDLDRKDLIEDFREAYNNLQNTIDDLPTFEDLISRLLHSIRRTRVEEVNSTRGKTPEIDWKANYSHILVGGQAMDRGFTVEGLTVTYMPRGVGVGNADTVQQRARFFGYKNSYLGYCRVFLESIVCDSYKQYVAHEEDIRKQLLIHHSTGKPLSEWKRAFFLKKNLKPTRDNVLDLDYMRGNYSDDWYAPKAPHDSDEAIKVNLNVIDLFLSKLGSISIPDPGHKDRTIKQHHLVISNLSLNDVYEQLLTQLRITRPKDSQRFIGMLIQIRNYLERYPTKSCTVYILSRGINPNETRERTLDEKDEIPNLFQGANGKVYPGDRYIRNEQELTIQIQYLQVFRKKIDGKEELIANNVPAVTVWLPKTMSVDWYVQEQSTS